MSAADPPDRAEYERRFAASTAVEGFGLDVRMVSACPFCAAPGFTAWYPAGELSGRESIDAQMGTEATCRRCGRSGKTMVTRTPEGASAEFVQTGGEDPPPYLDPPPRRLP